MPDVELKIIPVETETFEIWAYGAIVGFISWRRSHEWLSRGHVSYEVAESYRNHGYAKAALATLLGRIEANWPEVINQVQVCCAVDNVPSRAVIEANGGVRDLSRGEIFQDPTDGKWTISYWVPVKKPLDSQVKKD